MKRPSITFDKEKVADFLVRHGEKFIVAAAALVACGLTWGGFRAWTAQAASEQQRPVALERTAAEAARHIEQEKAAPASEKRVTQPLAKAIEPWRSPDVTAPPALALLDRPLFEESAKRSQPDVFPIEDLRAVAGLAVLPVKPAAAAQAGERPRVDPEPGGDQARAKIVPYVIVTGLIPRSKQAAEYRRRFENAGFQDPKRDSPLWADWTVERTVVGPGGERWEKINLEDAMRRAQAEWAGIAADRVPEFLQLGAADRRNPKTTPPYCSPLPQRLRGSWGTAAAHPWVIERARRQTTPAPVETAPEPSGAEAGTNIFGEEQAAPPGGGPQQPVAAGEPAATDVEFAMFRFIDTSVAPGKTYRYRVKHELWNPNYKVPTQHLDNAALAETVKLPSPQSNETTAVGAPNSTTTLLAMLRKEQMKKFKPGFFELLVLGPSEETGDYALRGLITEVGGLVNVDGKLNKPGDRRTRGEEIATDRVVVDVRGRQEDRADGVKTNRPPEPFEVICLRPDGSFEFASAADSEDLVAEHQGTLPAAESPKPDSKPGQPGTGGGPL